MGRKFNRHRRNDKRRRQWKHRHSLVVRHFTECKQGAYARIISPDAELRRCIMCGLSYHLVKTGGATEIQIKGMTRLPEQPTVLDLMSLQEQKTS